KLFAMVEGKAVTGYAYAPGGVRLPNNTVEIFDGSGNKLAETTTDANGAFSFTPQKRSDLSFELDTGDGHRTTFLISAAELAASLPAAGAQEAAPATTVQSAVPAATKAVAKPTAVTAMAEATPSPTAAPATADPAELAALIDQAVAHNIRPLREQIEAYEQKVRLHDILGGIGYIMGLAGIFAYLQAGKKEKASGGK
ncbi:MAG: hypothetical protein OEV73_02965, partial [Desulfobulbaceae bacterium]|nr:hypothetical protein [Desulfobulbaceae bacterium]